MRFPAVPRSCPLWEGSREDWEPYFSSKRLSSSACSVGCEGALVLIRSAPTAQYYTMDIPIAPLSYQGQGGWAGPLGG